MNFKRKLASAIAIVALAPVGLIATPEAAHATCGIKNSSSSNHYLLGRYDDGTATYISKGKSSGCYIRAISTGDPRYIARLNKGGGPTVGSGWTDVSGVAWNYSTWTVSSR